jgi:Ca2+-binding RTX toxin-like protein
MLAIAPWILTVAFLTWGAGPAVAAAAPVAHWAFDEGSGTQALDSAGEHDGLIQGADYTTEVSPAPGSTFALDFNGDGDRVRVDDAADLDFVPTDQMTLALWFRKDSSPETYHLLAKRLEEGPMNYQLGRDAGGIQFNSIGGVVNTSVSDVAEDMWTHLAATYDGTSLKIYVNGAVVGSASPYTLGNPNNADLVIGATADTFGDQFPGKIDDVRVYRSALTDAEIAALAGVSEEITVEIDDVTVSEGDGNAVFTVSLSDPSAGATVDYATAEGSATDPEDFTGQDGTLTFGVDDETETVTVPIVNDGVHEETESFTVNLSGAVGATIADPQGTGTITDDDPAGDLPVLNAAPDRNIVEGNDGAKRVELAITLSEASDLPVTVGFVYQEGTATLFDGDFTAPNADDTFTIPAGITRIDAPYSFVRGDPFTEPDEFFTLDLTSATNATLGDTHTVVTIVNDDSGDFPKCPGLAFLPGKHWVGTSGDDSLQGSEGVDVICGLGGNDSVSGLGGDDWLAGGPGFDGVYGGEGVDRLDGGSEADTLDGGAGDDTLLGFAGDDFLGGSTGNDILQGDVGADLLHGGTGTDQLFAGAGDDKMVDGSGEQDLYRGGEGLDRVTYPISSAAVEVTLDGVANDGVAGRRNENVFTDVEIVAGGSGPDRLVGNGQANVLVGNRGMDVLVGGGGDDHLIGDMEPANFTIGDEDHLEGGPGNDVLEGGEESDVMLGGDGDDSLIGDPGDCFPSDCGADTLDGGAGNDTLTGGSLGDTILGGDGADQMAGERGSDVLRGDAGDDVLDGDELACASPVGSDTDADTLDGGAGADILRGCRGNDTLTGGTGTDTVTGGKGNDTINEGSRLRGGAGADSISGGEGTDTVSYAGSIAAVRISPNGTADDGVSGEGDNVPLDIEVMVGGSGADTIVGAHRAEVLRGGSGNDSLSGNGNDDSLFGESGDDFLSGGGGNDALDGGSGRDSCTGGGGSNTLTACEVSG